MDWNNDGKKDLLTGGYDGYTRLYLNVGTDAAPVFNGYTNIQVGGSDFEPYWYSVPWITDWNEDGKKDLIIGFGNLIFDPGPIYVLINTGSDAAPSFASAYILQDGGSPLFAGDKQAPCVVDYNRDGKKDLIVGNSDGHIMYFENKGTNAAPAFNGGQFLQIDGADLQVAPGLEAPGYARPTVVDWNEDGILDILSGSFGVTGPPEYLMVGYLYYYENFDPLTTNPDPATISEATGGSVGFPLRAGKYNAGRKYILLPSVTGTSPGIPLPGGKVVLPVNKDPYTDLCLMFLNSPLFDHFCGILDSQGEALATFNVPPLPPGFVGLQIYHAFCLNNPFDFASNVATVTVVP